jgi:hypothetical protein
MRHREPYGVSHAAMPAYYAMIKSFSPAEIKIMLELPNTKSTVENRYEVTAVAEPRSSSSSACSIAQAFQLSYAPLTKDGPKVKLDI